MVIHSNQVDIESMSDEQLAARAAGEETDAFRVLYERHAAVAWRLAFAITGNAHDAADAVSEAFARLIAGFASGRVAKTVAFVPYLLTTTRNTSIDVLRRRRRVTASEADLAAMPALSPGPAEHLTDMVDASMVRSAFRGLPERWRSVLWLTEVEGMPAREVGKQLGISANAASQLAVRARERLRERYVEEHVRVERDPACAETTSQLSAYVAGTLRPRALSKMDQHLAHCEDCRARLAEVRRVEATLPVLVPLLPSSLAAATLARLRMAKALHPVSHASQVLLGGPRAVQVAARATRPMALSTAGLLALGVISAAVIGDNGGAGIVNASRTPVSGPAGGTEALGQLAAAPAVLPPGLTLTATVPSAAPAAPVVSTAGVTPPTRVPPPPPTTTLPPPITTTITTTTTKPTLEVGVGANVGATTGAAAVGVGTNSCTGVSVAGSSGCAKTYVPAKPGLNSVVVLPVLTSTQR